MSRQNDLPKMMPGQEPYTPEEWREVQDLIHDALDAEDMFEPWELEAYARKQNV